jgi:serine/threonine protein kinase
MSPEQIRGMPLDARTDVFSTGIILHEMLTTEKLFRGDTEFALMEKVRKADVPPPSQFNRRVTPELDAIVGRALARDVADRYQSAALFARDLDALIEGYRFDPKELRQFMRQMFRKEYARELEDNQAALESQPLPSGGSLTIPPIGGGSGGTTTSESSAPYVSLQSGGSADAYTTGAGGSSGSQITDGSTTNPNPVGRSPAAQVAPGRPTGPQAVPEPIPPENDRPRSTSFWGNLFKRNKKTPE